MDNALLVSLAELVRQQISAEHMLKSMVDVITRALDADRGTIYLFDHELDELVSVAAHLPELAELRVPLGQGVAGYVAKTRERVNIPSSSGDERFWRSVDERTGYSTETMLAGPLIGEGGRLIGVAQVLNKHSVGGFSAEDERLFATLSEQAAALLEETTLSRPEPADAGREDAPSLGERFNGIVGRGKAMRGVYRSVRRVAPPRGPGPGPPRKKNLFQ